MKNPDLFGEAVRTALQGAPVEFELCAVLEAREQEAVEQVAALHQAVEELLRAYARGEARGGSTDWEDLNSAFECAKQALPGRYEAMLGLEQEDCEDEAAKTYRIVRRYRAAPAPEVIQTGYTLEEAKRHCEDPSTHGVDWMDTWEQE